MKTENVAAEGTITSCLADYKFVVELDNGHTLIAHLGGRLPSSITSAVRHDRVVVEISSYSLAGHITKRF